MKKWKYISALCSLWLLFSIASILFLFRFILTYGKVEVRFDYTAFKREDITLYWNDGTGWKAENHFTKTTKKGRHVYTYYIRQTDTITMLRVDPDEACDSAILYSVVVNGISCPLTFSDFGKNEHNGSRVIPAAGGTKIIRDRDNDDPFIIIHILASCRPVVFKMKKREMGYIAFILLLDVLILVIAIRRRFLLRFFEQQGLWKLSVVLSFLLFISMYWANRVLEFYPEQPNIENRMLEKFPKWKLLAHRPDSFFTRCTQWCCDNFYYRNILIGSRSAAYIKFLRESPIPAKVMIGKDFMFFPSHEVLLKDFEGKMQYEADQVSSICCNAREKHDLLAQHGIRFMLVMPPSKQTIYNDLMPEYYRLHEKKPSLLDQVAEGMKAYKIDYFISLADTLKYLCHRYPHKQLYYKYDTHWNEYGAFKAYQVVMNYLHSADTSFARALNDKNITIDTLKDNDADLAKCLIVNDIYKRTIFKIQPKIRDSITIKTIGEKHPGPTYIYNNPKGHGRILFFRDSYTIQWASYFAHHFNQCILIWDHNMDLKEILRYKPDVVIEEVGEMFIDNLFLPMKSKQGDAPK